MPNLSSSQAEKATSALEERLETVALRHPDFELALTGTTIVVDGGLTWNYVEKH